MPPKILIVDDENVVGKVLVDALEGAGYETAQALSAKDGLEMIQNFRPDLIISDVWMPGMNGYTFCKLAKKMSNASIIMMSGVPSEVSVLKEMNIGADDILIKPIDLEELSVRVDALLQKDTPTAHQENGVSDSSNSPVSDGEQDPNEIFKIIRHSIKDSVGRMADRLGVSEDIAYQIILLTLDDVPDGEIADNLNVEVNQVQNWRELILANYGIDMFSGANPKMKIIEALILESQQSPNIAAFISGKQEPIGENGINLLPDDTVSVLHRYANGWDITSISNDLDIDQLSVKEHMELACYHLDIGHDSPKDRHLIAASLYLIHQLGQDNSDQLSHGKGSIRNT